MSADMTKSICKATFLAKVTAKIVLDNFSSFMTIHQIIIDKK